MMSCIINGLQNKILIGKVCKIYAFSLLVIRIKYLIYVELLGLMSFLCWSLLTKMFVRKDPCLDFSF